MKLPVNRSQILTIDMSVYLRRRDVGVTEHFLHRSQIGTALEQVSREGVSQSMGRHRLGYSCLVDILPENLPCSHSRHRLTARIEKKNVLPFTLLEARAQLTQIDSHCPDRLSSYRDESLLRAFPKNSDEMFFHEHVANRYRDPLRYPQSGAVGELEHSSIPEGKWLVQRWR